MSINAEQIIAEARTWINTPWQHQGRLKGVGCDCGGLLVGVGRALGVELEDTQGYGRIPSGFAYQEYLNRSLTPKPVIDAAPGDVVLMFWGREPMHTAIDCGETFIHAWEAPGKVIETIWSPRWTARVTHRWCVPGLEP